MNIGKRNRIKNRRAKSSPQLSDGLPQTNEETYRDLLFMRLRREAAEVAKQEPILGVLLSKAGLLDTDPAKSFDEVISRIVSHRLASCSGGLHASYGNLCPKYLRGLLEDTFRSPELELGHTMAESVREDAQAIVTRDPAVDTLLEAVLFSKGFHSLVLHRAARRAWKPSATTAAAAEDGEASETAGSDHGHRAGRAQESVGGGKGGRFVALLLQSQASASFGVDIHPAAGIGAGVMFDHATGVVVGETATIGDGTTILHGVTLGGTGKGGGIDRHPKIGRDVLVGAHTQILGAITVGDRAKIGAGSVVLRPIPSGATAVGAPAKIIGFTPRGERPGSSVDSNLEVVEPLTTRGKMSDKESSGALSALTERTATTVESGGSVAAEAATGTAQTEPMPDAVQTSAQEKEKQECKNIAETNGRDEADAEEEGEDDDDVTDFGTKPRCRFLKTSCGGRGADDGLCPFRGTFRNTVALSSSVRRDCLSHAELRQLLAQEGCSEGEIVEVFFELLHRTPPGSTARQCGSIPLDVFAAAFAEVAAGKTRLDAGTRRALAEGDLRTLAMSKKASRRFRAIFATLGKKQQQRGKTPAWKSESALMINHPDTDGYAEGIVI